MTLANGGNTSATGKGDHCEGKVRKTYPTAAVTTGSMKKVSFTGQGVLVLLTARNTPAIFSKDSPLEKGMEYPNGDRYEGEFKNNKCMAGRSEQGRWQKIQRRTGKRPAPWQWRHDPGRWPTVEVNFEAADSSAPSKETQYGQSLHPHPTFRDSLGEQVVEFVWGRHRRTARDLPLP